MQSSFGIPFADREGKSALENQSVASLGGMAVSDSSWCWRVFRFNSWRAVMLDVCKETFRCLRNLRSKRFMGLDGLRFGLRFNFEGDWACEMIGVTDAMLTLKQKQMY
jgi:hypothetical protein